MCEDSNRVNSGPDEEKSYVGEKLGPLDFELLRVVGQGAFGKVFKRGEKEQMKFMPKLKLQLSQAIMWII